MLRCWGFGWGAVNGREAQRSTFLCIKWLHSILKEKLFNLGFFLCLSKTNLVSFSIAKEEGTEKLIRQEVNTTEGCLPLTRCVTLNKRPELVQNGCPETTPSAVLEDDAFLRDSSLFWLLSCLVSPCLNP